MRLRLHRTAIVTLSAALASLSPALIRADGPGSDAKAPKPASKAAERASGVIVKVEKVANTQNAGTDKEHSRKLRLTLNTAAVWRDWARDQAAESVSKSPKTAAADGANSVAAKGEPRSKNTEVTIDLGSDSQIETRFRTLDDETSKGSRRNAAKPTAFRAEDLKPGLFVEVDFGRKGEKNLASSVTVIRAVVK